MPVAEPTEPDAGRDADDDSARGDEWEECRDSERRSPPSGVICVAASTVVTVRVVAVAVAEVLEGRDRIKARVGERGDDADTTRDAITGEDVRLERCEAEPRDDAVTRAAGEGDFEAA